jgi:hypothetical protein
LRLRTPLQRLAAALLLAVAKALTLRLAAALRQVLGQTPELVKSSRLKLAGAALVLLPEARLELALGLALGLALALGPELGLGLGLGPELGLALGPEPEPEPEPGLALELELELELELAVVELRSRSKNRWTRNRRLSARRVTSSSRCRTAVSPASRLAWSGRR